MSTLNVLMEFRVCHVFCKDKKMSSIKAWYNYSMQFYLPNAQTHGPLCLPLKVFSFSVALFFQDLGLPSVVNNRIETVLELFPPHQSSLSGTEQIGYATYCMPFEGPMTSKPFYVYIYITFQGDYSHRYHT